MSLEACSRVRSGPWWSPAAARAGRIWPALGIPVITTVNGKGVLDEKHPLSLGASIRLRAAQRYLADADVVLAIGTELGESDLWGDVPALRHVIRVDIDPAQRDKNVRADVAITGDAREVVQALTTDREPAQLNGVREAIREEALKDGARGCR